MSQPLSRIAGAPISWGVSEAPGWGRQLSPARVLTEMAELGLTATEFGPDGFLPRSPQAKAALLASHGLHGIGGFLPLVLHDPAEDPAGEIDDFLDECVTAAGGVMVIAAVSGVRGYEQRPELDVAGWHRLFANLDLVREAASRRGVTAVLHPHVGTLIEREQDVHRVLDGSGIGLCLDTGHLVLGGADPVALVRSHADRIAHVHLKDVDLGVAGRVRAGEIGYADAVRAGLYRPLGQGDVPIKAVVEALSSSGYPGWWVLEQDVIIEDGRSPATTSVTPLANVRKSLALLRELLG